MFWVDYGNFNIFNPDSNWTLTSLLDLDANWLRCFRWCIALRAPEAGLWRGHANARRGGCNGGWSTETAPGDSLRRWWDSSIEAAGAKLSVGTTRSQLTANIPQGPRACWLLVIVTVQSKVWLTVLNSLNGFNTTRYTTMIFWEQNKTSHFQTTFCSEPGGQGFAEFPGGHAEQTLRWRRWVECVPLKKLEDGLRGMAGTLW